MGAERERLRHGSKADMAKLAVFPSRATAVWDLWVYRKVSSNVAGGNELASLGTVREVRAMIESSLDVEWRGPFWCVYNGEGFDLEFDVGGVDSRQQDMLDSINIQVRGNGDAKPLLIEFSLANHLTLCDLSTGEEMAFFTEVDEAWKLTNNLASYALDEFKGRRYIKPSQNDSHAPAALPSNIDKDLDISVFTYLWGNPKEESHGLVALEADELLIGCVSPKIIEELVVQHALKKRVRVPKHILKLGSQRRRLRSIVEVIDYLNDNRVSLIFCGAEEPTLICFSSLDEKTAFIEILMGRLPMPKRTFEVEKLIGNQSLYILAVAMLLALGGMYWSVEYALVASIIIGGIMTLPLLRYAIKGPRMYEIYSFI